jgi:hypothetical protein
MVVPIMPGSSEFTVTSAGSGANGCCATSSITWAITTLLMGHGERDPRRRRVA